MDNVRSSTFPFLEQSLGSGVEFRVIMPADIEVPKLPEELPPPDFSKYRGNLMEPRHLEKVTHVVILSESEGILTLPDLDGRLDYFRFRIEDSLGLHWCHDLFVHFWDKANPIVFR